MAEPWIQEGSLPAAPSLYAPVRSCLWPKCWATVTNRSSTGTSRSTAPVVSCRREAAVFSLANRRSRRISIRRHASPIARPFLSGIPLIAAAPYCFRCSLAPATEAPIARSCRCCAPPRPGGCSGGADHAAFRGSGTIPLPASPYKAVGACRVLPWRIRVVSDAGSTTIGVTNGRQRQCRLLGASPAAGRVVCRQIVFCQRDRSPWSRHCHRRPTGRGGIDFGRLRRELIQPGTVALRKLLLGGVATWCHHPICVRGIGAATEGVRGDQKSRNVFRGVRGSWDSSPQKKIGIATFIFWCGQYIYGFRRSALPCIGARPDNPAARGKARARPGAGLRHHRLFDLRPYRQNEPGWWLSTLQRKAPNSFLVPLKGSRAPNRRLGLVFPWIAWPA